MGCKTEFCLHDYASVFHRHDLTGFHLPFVKAYDFTISFLKALLFGKEVTLITYGFIQFQSCHPFLRGVEITVECSDSMDHDNCCLTLINI